MQPAPQAQLVLAVLQVQTEQLVLQVLQVLRARQAPLEQPELRVPPEKQVLLVLQERLVLSAVQVLQAPLEQPELQVSRERRVRQGRLVLSALPAPLVRPALAVLPVQTAPLAPLVLQAPLDLLAPLVRPAHKVQQV